MNFMICKDNAMIKKSIIIILIFGVIIQGIACHSYSTIRPGIGNTNEKLDTVRITTVDDKVYTLTDAKIDSNQIKGMAYSSHSDFLAGRQKKEIAIPLRDIKQLEVREYDGTTTGFIFLGIGLTLLILLVIGSASMSGFGSGMKWK